MKVEHQISIVVLFTIILVVVICKNSETNTLCVRNTHVGAAVGDGTSHKVSSLNIFILRRSLAMFILLRYVCKFKCKVPNCLSANDILM